MLGKLIKLVLLLFLIVGLIYVGACVYGNFFATKAIQDNIPDVKDAQYSLKVVNTGMTLFTDEYEQMGNKAGQRVFIINDFWELEGQKFKHKKPTRPLVLDESVFGPIELTRRTQQ